MKVELFTTIVLILSFLSKLMSSIYVIRAENKMLVSKDPHMTNVIKNYRLSTITMTVLFSLFYFYLIFLRSKVIGSPSQVLTTIILFLSGINMLIYSVINTVTGVDIFKKGQLKDKIETGFVLTCQYIMTVLMFVVASYRLK